MASDSTIATHCIYFSPTELKDIRLQALSTFHQANARGLTYTSRW